MHEFN